VVIVVASSSGGGALPRQTVAHPVAKPAKSSLTQDLNALDQAVDRAARR
jgi:hypothetical protein